MGYPRRNQEYRDEGGLAIVEAGVFFALKKEGVIKKVKGKIYNTNNVSRAPESLQTLGEYLQTLGVPPQDQK